MNPEQGKINKFLDKFMNMGMTKSVSKVVRVIVMVLLMICSFVPAQYFGLEESEWFVPFMPIGSVFFSALASMLRVLPYETFVEKHNNMGSGMDLLEYHPICKIELAKYKIRHIIVFLAKLFLVCVIVQLAAAYVMFATISWANVGYIFLFVFFIPAIYECVPRWFRAKYNYGG